MNRARARVARLLYEVASVRDGKARRILCHYLPPQVRDHLDQEGTPQEFAEELLAQAVKQRKLGVVLRWLRYLEDGSPRTLQVFQEADILLETEEQGLGDVSQEEEQAWRELRRALRRIPCDDRVKRSYEAAGEHSLVMLEGSETPEPLDAWEAFLDLQDLGPDLQGKRPDSVFLHWLAERTSDSRVIGAVRQWLEYQGTLFEEAPPERKAESFSGDSASSRVFIEVVPDPDMVELFQITYWTVTTGETGEPHVFGTPESVSGVSEQELPRRLSALVADTEKKPRTGHGRFRLEFILPFSLLFRFPVQHWLSRAPRGVEPMRFGSKYEIVFRSKEFLEDDAYQVSRWSCERRWNYLKRGTRGLVKRSSESEMPPGLSTSDYLSDERIVAFHICGTSETKWENQVYTAVYCGVPVVAWCDSRGGHTCRTSFSGLLGGAEGEVYEAEVRSLPENLHLARVRNSTPEEQKSAQESYGMSVIYHDRQQVFPDHPDILSTGNIG